MAEYKLSFLPCDLSHLEFRAYLVDLLDPEKTETGQLYEAIRPTVDLTAISLVVRTGKFRLEMTTTTMTMMTKK